MMSSQQRIDWESVSSEIRNIYAAADALERVFPKRSFTPDGHLVGSIGEALAAYIFDLVLEPPLTPGHDAVTKDGKTKIEIKFTAGDRVGMRNEPAHLIVLQRKICCSARVVYNGPGSIAWKNAGKMQKNGQCSISVAKLLRLYEEVPLNKQLPAKNNIPI